MPSPILARADALMHRKRQNEGGFDDLPVLTDAIGDDEDIPVLLEVAPAAHEVVVADPDPVEAHHQEADTAPETTVTGSAEPVPVITPLVASISQNAALREELASELARRVEQRLASELPRIIESTLREFLAEQEMIAAATPRD
ncbi:MAG TPA: hypothetical protein VK165_00585 [Azonexus sp.]|nr:hypothetical protein [Azonexus sp.]